MIQHQLPYDLPARIATTLRVVSDVRINRPWRSRSNVTHYKWVDQARYVAGSFPILELWDIAACLYAACAARMIGSAHFQGRDVTPDGWQSIAALLQDFRKSKPEHAMSRRVWCELHPRTTGTKGQRA